MTRIFLISIYALVALASLMLAIAEELPLPTGLTVPLAAVAFHLNETRRRIRLTTLWANTLGLGAFGVAGLELFLASYAGAGSAAELRVLAGAHLLTYLTWVALFQAKEGRQYWWLMGLSVMQVAVGSILTQDGAFGALLIAYVFFALWTLSVFSLYQARFGFERAGRESADVAIEDVQTNGPAAVLTPGGGPALLMAHHRGDEVRGAIQLDPNEEWVNSRFVAGVVSTTLLSLSVGLIFFVLIPRLWVGGRHQIGESFDTPIRTVTGFTDEVQLGDIGQILESTEPVFQVRFYDSRSNEELSVESTSNTLGYTEPLFRGSVMGRYSSGHWHVLEESRNVSPLLEPQPSLRRQRIRQHYILHATTSKTLFGMHPVNRADLDERYVAPAMDVVSSILMRADEQRMTTRQTEYVLYGYIPREENQRPRVAEVYNERAGRIRERVRDKYFELPDNLEELQSLARQIAGVAPGQPVPVDQQDRVIDAIESYLRDTGGFSYSLNATIVDRDVDPVEDFLFNRKEGHCEYFASAMALMLRSVGIPSRLVSGFKGGEQNALSGAFVVQERHAHAWVEAYADGRWRICDSTPADARAASVQQIGDGRNMVASFRDLFSGFWNQRVLRMSYDEQRRTLYEPLGIWAKSKLMAFTEPFGDSGRRVADFLSDPRQWFSLTTFIATAILCVVCIGVRWLWRRYRPENASSWWHLVRLLAARLRRWFASDAVRERIEFYERFIAILARNGLHRQSHQTPLEFAAVARARLNERLAGNELDSFPDDLVRLFYRVRYGQNPLTSQERTTVEELLANLSNTLRQTRRRNGPTEDRNA